MREEGTKSMCTGKGQTMCRLGAYSMADMSAVDGLGCSLLILGKKLRTLVHSGKILLDNTI